MMLVTESVILVLNMTSVLTVNSDLLLSVLIELKRRKEKLPKWVELFRGASFRNIVGEWT